MFDLFRKNTMITQRNNLALSFDYSITHSKRKTLSIQVKDQQVIVKAPLKIAKKEIINFIVAKQHWIEEKIAIQQQKAARSEAIRLNQQILVGGELKKMLFYSGDNHSIIETLNTLEITIPRRIRSDNQNDYVKKKLLEWLKHNANQYLPNRLHQLSTECHLFPEALEIKKYKARWGSCNSKGLINLNYLLMMTPHFVIDYVIVHELCHLKHMNHSKDFWQLVEYHYPKYKYAQQWLKENHTLLQANNL